jgi:hypothetical protein
VCYEYSPTIYIKEEKLQGGGDCFKSKWIYLMAKSGYKGISRIDQEERRTHGWYVRVRFGDTTHSKFFRDSAHGGKDEALKKAVQYRNQLEKDLGIPRTDNVVVIKNSRNKTGIVGIQRRIKRTRGKNGEWHASEVYEVTWNAGREIMGKTSVSISKHGEAEAFRRACAIRRKKEQRMYGSTVAGKWADALSKMVRADKQ